MSSLATLILLFLSDALVVRRSSGGSRAGRRRAGSNLGTTSSDGCAPPPVSRLHVWPALAMLRSALCGPAAQQGDTAGAHLMHLCRSLLQAGAV